MWQLILVVLVLLSGIAGNLLAGWIQQDIWSNIFSRKRVLVTVAVALITTMAVVSPEPMPLDQSTLDNSAPSRYAKTIEQNITANSDGSVQQAGRDINNYNFTYLDPTPTPRPPTPTPRLPTPTKLPTPVMRLTGSSPRPIPTYTALLRSELSNEQMSVMAVIDEEVNATIAQNLTRLKRIFTTDAIIIDARETKDDLTDDQIVQGWDEIKRRYLAFFLCCSYAYELYAPKIEVQGTYATVIHRGIIINGSYYPNMTLYELRKVNGQWLITSLTHNVKDRQ